MDARDAIDEVFTGLRVIDSMVGRCLVHDQWGVEVAAASQWIVIGCQRGSSVVTIPGVVPQHLGEGDLAVIAGPVVVRAGDGLSQRVDVVITDRDTCFDPATGIDLQSACHLGGRTFGVPDAPQSVVIGGFALAGIAQQVLAQAMPRIMVARSEPAQTAILEALGHETKSEREGADAAVARLMELLLISAVRRLVGSQDEGQSWLRAMKHPTVGPALRAMAADPARDWKVSVLADHAAVSRATFARQFKTHVGVSPMAHLTRIRVGAAGDLLTHSPELTLTAIARRVGYADGYVLSAAFKREVGVSPREFRAYGREPAR